MKRIIFLILVSVSTVYAQQFVWTQKASLPGNTRHSPVAFSIGQFGYIGLGYQGGSFYSDFWKYDPLTNTWSQIASMPGDSRFGASSFVIGNKAYVGLGLNSSNQYKGDFYEYNPATNQWMAIANYPGTKVYTAVSFGINGLGYVATGYPLSNEVYQYNPPSNSWQQRATFPGGARQSAASFVVNDTAYIVTGFGNNSNYGDFWRFNQLSDTWTQLQGIPNTPRYGASALTVNGMGILFTGSSAPNNFLNDAYVYSPPINQWIAIANFPGLGRRHAGNFSIGNNGYVACGVSTNGELNDLWELSEVTAVHDYVSSDMVGATFNSQSQQLVVRNSAAKTLTVSVYAVNGSELLRQQLSPSSVQQINLANHPAGVYMYAISDGAATVKSGKVVL